MHLFSKTALGTAAVAALTLGSTASTAQAQVTVDLTASSNYTVSDYILGTTPPFDDAGDSIATTQGQLFVGVRQGPDGPSNRQVQRAGVFFDLSSIPDGQVITSATLNLQVNAFAGSGTFFPDVSLFHSVTTNDDSAGAALYEDASFSDTGEDPLAAGGGTSGVIMIDVTGEVGADYATDDASAFRLQMDTAGWFNPSTIGTTRYLLDSIGDGGPGGAGTNPTLTVTYEPIPEPATLGLLSVAGLGLLRRRRA
ncbi:MAG: PEP-CTERM sorting domain-containing protein [Planctomycetota bacterium]